MIDIEQPVFSIIAPAVRAAFPDAYITNIQPSAFAKFPAVAIVEKDNSVYQKRTTLKIENAARLMYEAYIFSNEVGGEKKIQAKEIAQVIDREFAKIGFTRIMGGEVDNLSDSSIYQYVLRYEAVADKDFWIYNN